MSIRVQNYVWQLQLPPSVKLVAIALADHAHDDGTEARPSQALLMAKTGLSKMSVRRAIIHLTETGVITLERPASQHRANVYRFNLPDEVRGTTVRPPANSQRDQQGPQRDHGGTPEVTPRSPNHKNRYLNQGTTDEQAESVAIRNREVLEFGRVLTDRERARRATAGIRGEVFTLDMTEGTK